MKRKGCFRIQFIVCNERKLFVVLFLSILHCRRWILGLTNHCYLLCTLSAEMYKKQTTQHVYRPLKSLLMNAEIVKHKVGTVLNRLQMINSRCPKICSVLLCSLELYKKEKLSCDKYILMTNNPYRKHQHILQSNGTASYAISIIK